MKIYIAARYGRRVEMASYAKQLVAAGHIVTSRWLSGEHEAHDAMPAETWTKFALDDIDDIQAADWFVTFTEFPTKDFVRGATARGGRHFESGYAYCLNMRTIVIGFRENVFHWLPSVEFYLCWADFLATLPLPEIP